MSSAILSHPKSPPMHDLSHSPSADVDMTPSSPHSTTSSLDSDSNHSVSADEDLRARLTKLRRYYTNATMTGENDRFGFEQGLMDIEIFFNDVEKTFSSQIESIKAELSLSHKEKDIKVKEWRERYQKLHDRWDECMVQLKQLQDEKEDVRQQRDLLMCTHKAKKAMTEHGSTLASGQKDKRILREFFQKRVAYRLLSSIAESIGAERGAIFVQDQKYLKSIALFPPLLKEGKAVEIKVPSDQGFVGTVFKNKEALNILNAYKDKRFYRKVDNETGFITRVVLCYPLLSPTSEKPIGVLQLINKENGEVFTVEDEARMSEYVYLVSHVLESVQKLYSFGPYLKAGEENANGDANEGSPGTPTAASRRKNIINVKRIGGEQRDMDQTGPGGQKMRKFLIPKEIEEYIRNVEQGWRKAVGESAEYQNKKAVLEEERTQLKTEVSEMEKRLHDKDTQIQDLQNKLQKYQKEMKMQRIDWMDKEKDLKQEVKELKQLHSTLNRQNSTFDHLKMLRGGSMTKILMKKASTIHLPQIDPNRNPTDHSNEDHESPKRNLNVEGDEQQPVSPSGFAAAGPNAGLASKYRDIYMDMFTLSPVPMILLTRQYRIWRVNQKFCALLDCSEQEVLGLLLSDIAVGVDVETLPRLLQFDVVQGLGLQKPQGDSLRRSGTQKPSKSFVKVNMQLSVLGQNGQKFQALKNGKTLRAPIYCCAFSKKKS